eukprot:XP_001699497.1 predicted protein [Chlamydomonas reinhardtii]
MRTLRACRRELLTLGLILLGCGFLRLPFQAEAARILQALSDAAGPASFPSSSQCVSDAMSSPITVVFAGGDMTTWCAAVETLSLATCDAKSECCARGAWPVARLEVLADRACTASNIAGVTVDGQPWSSFSFNAAAGVLSISNLYDPAVPALTSPQPNSQVVCVSLKGTGTCAKSAGLCRRITVGGDCAVLAADAAGACCPVAEAPTYQAADGSVPLDRETSQAFNVTLQLNRKSATYTCAKLGASRADRRALFKRVAATYAAALGLPGKSVAVEDSVCGRRSNVLSLLVRMSGGRLPHWAAVEGRSAAILKALSADTGGVLVAATPVVPSSRGKAATGSVSPSVSARANRNGPVFESTRSQGSTTGLSLRAGVWFAVVAVSHFGRSAASQQPTGTGTIHRLPAQPALKWNAHIHSSPYDNGYRVWSASGVDCGGGCSSGTAAGGGGVLGAGTGEPGAKIRSSTRRHRMHQQLLLPALTGPGLVLPPGVPPGACAGAVPSHRGRAAAGMAAGVATAAVVTPPEPAVATAPQMYCCRHDGFQLQRLRRGRERGASWCRAPASACGAASGRAWSPAARPAAGAAPAGSKRPEKTSVVVS